MNQKEAVAELQAALGHKPLTRNFAKFEIVLGLGGVWAGLLLMLRGGAWSAESQPLLLAASFALFVLGGYLAMAGSRSHLYQSSNELTAYLANQVRTARDDAKRE